MKRIFIIDGRRFSTLEGFFQEAGRTLVPGQRWGHNLDAFDEILSWPCLKRKESFLLIWRNAAVSRRRLSYSETVRQLQRRLRECDPSNLPDVREELA